MKPWPASDHLITWMRLALGFLLVTGLLSAGDLDRARELYNRTEYKEAATALLASPANEPRADARRLELLGQCYFMAGDFKKATEVLERAAALDPDDSTTQTWLGRAYGRRAETSFPLTAVGYANKTRDALEKAVRLDPGNGEALDDLFDFYVHAPGLMGGGFDKARRLLPGIARIDPSQAQFAQARIDEERKEFDAAEKKLRRALELSPGKLSRILDLARFLGKRGRYAESEETFRQAERIAPHSPRILFARADSYVGSHRNLSQARDLLTQYLASGELTPDDPPRWEAMALLKRAEGD